MKRKTIRFEAETRGEGKPYRVERIVNDEKFLLIGVIPGIILKEISSKNYLKKLNENDPFAF